MNEDIYHYGVLGMKWGQRRSQEELDRLAGRWREKETERVSKKYQKKISRTEKTIAKGKGKPPNKKTLNAVTQNSVLKAQMKKELSVVSKMKYKDITEEKKEFGKLYAKTFLLTFGLGPVGASIATMRWGPADKSEFRSKRRLGDDYYLNKAAKVKTR